MPFPFQCCFMTKSVRSEIYQAPEVKKAEDTTEKKYTWENRKDVDVSKYRVVGAEEEVVVKDDINGQQMIIENCKNSMIAIIDITASVVVDDCSGCTFIIGPCSGSVFIRTSEDCRVFYVGQQFRIRDCRQMNIAISCSTEPIMESSSAIRFYPLYLNYKGLHEQMISVGLTAFASNREVHDYTPQAHIRNYEMVDLALTINDPGRQQLATRCELSVNEEDSILIRRHPETNNEAKILLLALQKRIERYQDFYLRCYNAAKKGESDGLKYVNICESVVDEYRGQLLKDEFPAEIGNRLILMDVVGDKKKIDDLVEQSVAFRRVTKYPAEIRAHFFKS